MIVGGRVAKGLDEFRILGDVVGVHVGGRVKKGGGVTACYPLNG